MRWKSDTPEHLWTCSPGLFLGAQPMVIFFVWWLHKIIKPKLWENRVNQLTWERKVWICDEHQRSFSAPAYAVLIPSSVHLYYIVMPLGFHRCLLGVWRNKWLKYRSIWLLKFCCSCPKPGVSWFALISCVGEGLWWVRLTGGTGLLAAFIDKRIHIWYRWLLANEEWKDLSSVDIWT